MSETTKQSVTLPTLEELLKAGAHFGHRTSRWNPKMKQFIYGQREGVHIIDLIKTLKLLKIALAAVQENSDKGSVLLVGTKGQAASMVKRVAEENGAFYINTRWPGGLFTNHKMIAKSVSKLIKMEEHLAGGAEDLVKKEQLLLARDVARLNRLYEGIKFMDTLPSLVVVIDSKLEKNAIREAKTAGIPVVALVDTNCNPDSIKYPIPANDDSIKSIKLFLELFGKAIAAGKKSDRTVSLRNSHNAQLKKLATEYAQRVELEERQTEEERDRLKRMRAGEKVDMPSTVRVVKKVDNADSTSTVTRVTAAGKKVAPKTTPEKVDSKAVAKRPAAKKTESKNVVAIESTLEELGLSTRAINALNDAGIKTAAEVKKLSEEELVAIKGIGAVVAKNILKAAK